KTSWQKNSDARRQARGCRQSRIRLRDQRAPGVPSHQGRSQDRPLSIASSARRPLARPLAGAGGREATVRLSPAAHSSARRGPRFESKEDATAQNVALGAQKNVQPAITEPSLLG